LETKEEISKDILIMKSVPHDWLLPKCCAIVHHSGAGTCAAVLRSGIPSVPMPIYLDQPFGSNLIHKLGVAAEPIQFQKVNADILCKRLNDVLTSEPMKAKAKQVAQELKVDGVQRTIKLLDTIVAKYNSKA